MDAQRDQREPAIDDDSELSLGPQRILCVVCDNTLTTAAEAIAADGHHRHQRVNPAGFVFDIRCFGSAPGMVPVGEPDPRFTWFPGASWQIGLCLACQNHVGWAFSGRNVPFVALIVDRIREE